MKRLFFAIKVELNTPLLATITDLRQRLSADKMVWTEQKVHHITIRFLGKTADDKIPPLIRTMDELLPQFSPISLKMNKLGVFGSRYQPTTLWYGFEDFSPLVPLFEQMEEKLKGLGFEENKGNFVPHLTICRIKKLVDKGRFWKIVEGVDVGGGQEVSVGEVVLYRSRLQESGPEYTILKRWALGV